MKAIIGQFILEPSGAIYSPVSYYQDDGTFEEFKLFLVTSNDVQDNGLIPSVMDAVIAYATTKVWGMAPDDVQTPASKVLKIDGTWTDPAQKTVLTLANDAKTTALAPLTGLAFDYEINTAYKLFVIGKVSSEKCQFKLTFSSAIGSSIFTAPVAADLSIAGDGIVKSGATIGTAQLNFLSSTVDEVTVLASFSLIVEKIT